MCSDYASVDCIRWPRRFGIELCEGDEGVRGYAEARSCNKKAPSKRGFLIYAIDSRSDYASSAKYLIVLTI